LAVLEVVFSSLSGDESNVTKGKRHNIRTQRSGRVGS